VERDRTSVRLRRLNKRVYGLRTLGFVLSGLCVAASVYDDGYSSGWKLTAAFLQLLVWPHLAWLHVRRARDPQRAETRNQMLDSAFAGFWIAAIGFDALPTALIVSFLTMDRIMAGGGLFGLKALGVLALACAVSSAAFFHFRFDPYTSHFTLLACLPLLLLYPLVSGLANRHVAEKLIAQKRQLERSSRFDLATGLLNRQQLLHAATVALDRFGRTGRSSVLLLIDIDRFKQINDQHGHTVGDAVIEEFARLLSACLGDNDTGGRYGGDEFGIVLPDTHWPEAIETAERLRRQVAACRLFPKELQCTISVGLSETHPLIGSVTDWVDLADSALYAAKRRGRDCISVARPPKFVAAAADAERRAP
jgi:diguanylate cyclase